MPWDSSPHAGFSTGTPWLPLNPDCASRNVQRFAADPGSILNLYRRLIALRRARAALSRGDYVQAHVEGDLYAYERRHGGERLLVGLNFGHEQQSLTLPADAPGGTLLLSTHLDREGERVAVRAGLRAAEGVVIRLA